MDDEEFNFEKLTKEISNERYKKRISYLEEVERKETNHIIETVQNTMENLKNGKKSFIVYGEPQSGKTEMMLALTCKLLDEGHKMIIHLVTNINSLLNQNMKRFADSGIDPSPKGFEEVTTGNFQFGGNNHIIFCKKNPTNLKKLIESIKDIPSRVVIDDEADYATPDTNINNPNPDASKINSLTKKLIGNGIYIGVTATPARLDLGNTHGNIHWDWVEFCPHSKYTGQDTFFPLDDKRDYTLNILKEGYNEDEMLENAVLRFLVNVAHINLNSDKEENYSFLIHTSRKIEDHISKQEKILELFSIIEDDSNSLHKDYYKKIFEIAKKEYQGEAYAISRYIYKNRGRHKTILMNSVAKRGTMGEKPPWLFTIIIGGDVISRGVTFENLLSMFFTRAVKNTFQQDTYIQRARMFGSRGKYIEYFELTIPDDLYTNWHNAFADHRLSMASFKHVRESKGSPLWTYSGRNIPTSRGSIDRANVHTNRGEIALPIFSYDSTFESLINYKNPSETIKKLKEKYGEKVFPRGIMELMELPEERLEKAKMYKISDIKGWKGEGINKEELTRDKGFIATSGTFYEFDHHFQIVYNPKNKKARLYYKPSSEKKNFFINQKHLKKLA